MKFHSAIDGATLQLAVTDVMFTYRRKIILFLTNYSNTQINLSGIVPLRKNNLNRAVRKTAWTFDPHNKIYTEQARAFINTIRFSRRWQLTEMS